MLPNHDSAAPWRFGTFELDIAAGELRRGGRRVKLQPQPFSLLQLLVANPGRLITRDEIKRELWPEGTFVDFDQSVNFAVRQIREALGDSAESPLYIETVPRRGYRFIAPVQPVGASSERSTTVKINKAMWMNIAELRLAERRQKRWYWTVLIVLGTVICALTVLLLLRR